MTSISRADKAEALFRAGASCSQAVFAAFHDVAGMDEDKALRISSAFGGGFGGLREVCGAVSGMAMVIGYFDGYCNLSDKSQKLNAYGKTQDLIARFEEEQKSIICREMLGLKKGEVLPEPLVRDEAYYASRPCLGAVRLAAQILQDHYSVCDYS